MSPFLFAIFLLGLSSLATAANFTQVYEWTEEFDYEWPSVESRTQALEDGTYDPKARIKPLYMAAYGTRLFLGLLSGDGIPVTLGSLPTSSASSAPPKLTPFPSWGMHLHREGDCNKIKEVNGMEVDSAGRLWVLDRGNYFCKGKIWIIDLNNNDRIELIHQFSFYDLMHDLVLDETPNGTFAYISRWEERNIVVFSLERNESWIEKTPGIEGYPIALSPKEEPRQLYLGKRHSNELYSISVSALRSGTGTANPNLIGEWTAKPYRLMIDNHGTMYAVFLWENYILSWNTSLPFQEKRFHKVAGIFANRQFAFSLDQNGTFWITETDAKKEPRYMLRLLKTAVVEKSSEALPVAQATSQLQKRSTQQTEKSPFKVILICSVVFNLIFLGLIIMRKKRITCESDEMTGLYENHGYVNLRSRFP